MSFKFFNVLITGDGKCVICDSYVRPCTLVRICDECNYGSYQGRCVICGGPGVSDAYYCKECTMQEKDVSVLRNINSFNFNLISLWFLCIYKLEIFCYTNLSILLPLLYYICIIFINVNLSLYQCDFVFLIFSVMDVQRLLTWGAQRQIYSTKERNMVSERDNTETATFQFDIIP